MGLPDVRLVHRGHQRINLTIDQVPVHRRDRRRRRRRDESPAGADDGGGIGGRGEEEHKNNYNFKAESDNDDEQSSFHTERPVVGFNLIPPFHAKKLPVSYVSSAQRGKFNCKFT